MNVASLELCKELYEVSGRQTENNYHDNFGTPDVLSASVNQDSTYYKAGICPAYDAGFLLRKLPMQNGHHWLQLTTTTRWWAGYEDNANDLVFMVNGKKMLFESDTPEDALCKLAIELFKQGVLGKEQTDA